MKTFSLATIVKRVCSLITRLIIDGFHLEGVGVNVRVLEKAIQLHTHTYQP
jgi:hypothetical protein